MSLALLISFPAFVFSEVDPTSRVWMTVNGGVWGILLYFLSIDALTLKRRLQRKPGTV